jgi:hypothetical protein
MADPDGMTGSDVPDSDSPDSDSPDSDSPDSRQVYVRVAYDDSFAFLTFDGLDFDAHSHSVAIEWRGTGGNGVRTPLGPSFAAGGGARFAIEDFVVATTLDDQSIGGYLQGMPEWVDLQYGNYRDMRYVMGLAGDDRTKWLTQHNINFDREPIGVRFVRDP